jgi:PAS domain S-box-containing protein
MDGVQATCIIQQEVPESEVIIVSQNDPAIVSRQTAELGACGYVAKSDIARDLLPTIEKVVSRNGNNRSNPSAANSVSAGKNQASSHKEIAQKAQPLSSDSILVAPAWMVGGGEMGARMRSLDWSHTHLGAMEHWPQSLKTSISICLASRFPIVMYWGPEYVVLYNDAYSTILGSKHPSALGQRCRDCWAEIWDTIGPMLDSVVSSAQATWSDDLLLLLRRHGYAEECYFSFSFSPIRVETGGVGGVFTAVMETTDKVIGERRLRTLRDLAARAVDAHSESDAWRIAAETLAENLHDVPFSVLYQLDESANQVRVLGTAGIDSAHPLCTSLCTPGSSLFEHLRRAAHRREMFKLKDLRDWSGDLPHGAWQVPPQSALLLPIGDLGQERASGILLAAVNPQKALNDSYRTFFQLVAHQIATSVADARSHDEERKRAEALAELDRAKTHFFSNVSHEFRTPLTLMLGPLEDTLSAGEGLAPEHRERLEVAHRNSLRLLKLVNTLLDFSRIQAGRIQACYEPTDLATLTAELASVFRSATERAGLRLLVNCPELTEPIYVDREMWEKIVFNLLSNAFKFTFAGEIEVSLRQANGAVELAVRDTGTGIPPQDLSHLFERFYRVKSARGRTFEGSGIGLALVQELTKLHGGAVYVESEVDRGSTFIVTVPLGKDHLPAGRIGAARTLQSTGLHGETYVQEALHWLPNPPDISDDVQSAPLFLPVESLPPSERSEQKRARILLADDNADMREYVQRLLREQYEVLAVADGQSALENAQQQHPDLILTDIMMPRLDGFGLLRAVRADEALKGTPIILLSARAGEESRVEGLSAAADDYLVKPFSARELLARVGSHLAMAKMRREAAELGRELRAKAELERGRLRELFMQAPAAIGLLNGPEHRFTFVNLEYLRVTGRQRIEDFIGKTVREALPEIEGQEFLELLDDVLRTGVPYIGTARKVILNRTANAQPEEVYFDFIYQPMRDVAGQVEAILVHAVDVTRQVLARKEVEEREQHFRTLAESIPQLVWMAEPDGSIFWYNQRWYEFTGTKPEQMKGWGWQSVHDPGVLPKVVEKWKYSLATGEPFEMVFPLRGADGVFRDFLTRVHPVRNEHGTVIRWFGTNTDVTAQRKVEEAVRESERRFREMIDALPAAIYTTDAEGHLTHFNPAAVEFSGRVPELGSDQWCVTWKLFSADGTPLPHDQCPMAIALKEGRIVDGVECIAERPNGTRIWFTPYPRPLRNGEGRIVGGINMLVDITARKQAEEATAHLAAIVASSDDAIISKNLDGIIKSWNRSAERLFGYTAQEAVGKHITLIIPPDRRTEEEKILSRLRRGEHVDHFETVRMRKDGTTFDVSLTISPVKDSAGRVIGASKVSRDITHLKRIEQALRDSEERFRSIVDTTPECVKLVAADGTLLHMNSSGLGMVGADRSDMVVGSSVYDLITPEDRERFRVFNESVCRGEKGSLSFDFVRLDGERRHMETQAAPLRNPDGRVVQLAVTRDVTERKHAQEALRESEERLRALVNASSYVVYRMSPDWSEMRQLDGRGIISATEGPSKDWLQEYIHPDDQPLVLQRIQKAVQTKSVFELEHRVRRVDGTLGWTLSRAVPLLDEKGEITEWFGAASDVTPRKQAEENYRKLVETLDTEVRARTKELEERNADVLRQSKQVRELSWRLLQTQDEERRHIARELHDTAGQTLTVLGMNLASLVQKAGRKAPELAVDAEMIQETVQQLHREIRTTSYLLHPPLLDESGLSSALSWYVQGIVERTGLNITFNISEDFGRLPGDLELVVFRLVQECLTNIHRHSGSKTASIGIARESTAITVDVQDQGKGMSPERLAEIQSRGSGVGIRGMRERLRQFEGSLNIESGSSGTRIFATIPILQADVPQEQNRIETLQAAV